MPFGIGLIPGAPAYVSSLIGGGRTVYETALDERTTEQQMLDSVVAGHARAELYKNREARGAEVHTYCYFGKLYLVGEYDSQEQLEAIYESVGHVDNKREVISLLYLRDPRGDNTYFSEQARYMELQTQLVADLEVVSTQVEVEIVQGDIILLGVIKEKEERDRIMAHAMGVDGVNRVVSYLYHRENSGPEPQIMTAKLAPTAGHNTDIAPPPKKKAVKKRVRAKGAKAATTQTAAKGTTGHELVVFNPDRGR